MSLKTWGRYIQKQVYEKSRVGCILPKLIMYGKNIPTGFYEYPDITNECVLQTHRVFVFMPPVMQQVTFLHYVLGGHKAFKASRIGLKLWEFNSVLAKAKDFYEMNKNINFS